MSRSIGEIITFYSYKGGTGRSMVLANVGYILSGREYGDRRVLLIDWDLEAPGLERFFSGGMAASAGPGLIDYLVQMADRYRRLAPDTLLPESMARDPSAVEIFRASNEEHPLDSYITPLDSASQLWLMHAGHRPANSSAGENDYLEKVRTFDWDQFYKNYGSFFTHFRELLMSQFDYVLIDSRTGLTDIGGICTRVMPEKLVLVFAPNHQNIDGVTSMVRRALNYRMASRDPRSLTVFPVAARIDASASQLRTAWWRGGKIRDEQIIGYQTIFEQLLREMYELDTCDLGTYFDATQVPYDSDYAYGEAIAAAIDGTDDRLGIGYACDQLTQRLVKQTAPWEDLMPGSLLRVWNIPARNPGFIGRDELLAAVRERLLSTDKAVALALLGMGGVGKTQLAIEYAHRFADSYDVAWWINSEQAALIGEQFAALGMALGCVQAGAGIEMVRTAVLAELRGRGRWLLVFDNAEEPADIVRWLPGDSGHVLITSRGRWWVEVAAAVEVDVLVRAESVAILRDRVAGLGEADADQLAAQLGDLPLALAQAAGFMAETGMPTDQYLGLLRTHAARILDQAAPGSYPRSLAAATNLTADRLAQDDPAAAELASLCAFLAPEPIPENLFTNAINELPDDLAARAADPLAWRQTLAHLARQSLARIDQHGLQMNRLTQAILRDRLSPDRAAVTRERSEAILTANEPGDPGNPVTWPQWAQLIPHLLATDLARTGNSGLRRMACNACAYLLSRGDIRTGFDLAKNLRQIWRDLLGDDDESTLTIADYLAWALRDMGRYTEARDLDQEILARRRALGEDHPDTLTSASNLAIDLASLGEYQAARELSEDILARFRRVLGEDHPLTLTSANNLAVDLRNLGEYQAARELDEDILARRRRVLGEDHPDTLASASNLAADLQALGEYQAARELDEDTLARRRRALGEDHPDTLTSASNLAIDLASLGEYQAARELSEDILARRRRVLGEDHPDTLTSASNLAIDLASLGEYQAARELSEDILARFRQVLGEDHPLTLTSANNLAVDLRNLGEYQAARELDEDILARRRRVLGEDHPDTLASASNLAADLQALGEASHEP